MDKGGLREEEDVIIMKIQGPNPILNAYQKQQQKSIDKKQSEQKDKINISQTAKSLQKNQQHEVNRQNYVQEIKEQVQHGEYKVNHEQLAEKMIQFWSRN